jgi:hypothetical protein
MVVYMHACAYRVAKIHRVRYNIGHFLQMSLQLLVKLAENYIITNPMNLRHPVVLRYTGNHHTVMLTTIPASPTNHPSSSFFSSSSVVLAPSYLGSVCFCFLFFQDPGTSLALGLSSITAGFLQVVGLQSDTASKVAERGRGGGGGGSEPSRSASAAPSERVNGVSPTVISSSASTKSKGSHRFSDTDFCASGGNGSSLAGDKKTRFRVTLARTRIDTLQHNLVISM